METAHTDVKMNGKLFLCATPIGNLDDITLRVLDTLKSVDVIAAEDTRQTIKLLNHFGIKTPMTSYHNFNRFDKADELVKMMEKGKNVALVTDAGTPGISDPGEELVKAAAAAGIEVTSLPGPAACVTALTMSGLSTGRFCFEAFLPSEKKDRDAVLRELESETRTIVIYEAPHRLKKTLTLLSDALGDRKISVCREMTKLHEEVIRTTISGAAAHFEGEEPRGEFVLVIEGKSRRELELEEAKKWEGVSIREHVEGYIAAGDDKKTAMKKAAADRGVSKREIYSSMLEKNN